MNKTEALRMHILEDALGHIKVIAEASRVKTKRLDWIVARADLALRGYDRETMEAMKISLPKLRKKA